MKGFDKGVASKVLVAREQDRTRNKEFQLDRLRFIKDWQELIGVPLER